MHLGDYSRGAATSERMQLSIQRSGFTPSGQSIWTQEERAILVQFRGDYDAMCRRLPHRTRDAIRQQCASLRLTKRKRAWTSEEISTLRKLYPRATREEIFSAVPGRTWQQICWAARDRGFRRNKRPYKLTGVAALDELRAKCFEIKWTMRDLDAAAGTGRYFRTAGWSCRMEGHRPIGRAIEALDGILQPVWKD